MSTREDRPGRAMRRTKDEHRRRPSRRSRERAPGHSRRHAQVAQSGDTEDSLFDYVATAQICKNFLRHTLQPASPDSSQCPASTSPKYGVATVDEFVSTLLRRTRFPEYVVFAALFLLHRLRYSGVPLDADNACVLFLAAYVISAKMYEDTNFSNTYWAVLGRTVKKEDMDRWERELCGLLHWNLLVDPGVLDEFAKAVKRDFCGDGPYPDYRLEEDLSAPEKRFPQLPGNPIDEDEEEPLFAKPAAVPPASVLAALARHKRPVLDKPLPPLPVEHRIVACESSATIRARIKAGPCLDRPPYPPTCWNSAATWLPPVALRVPEHVLSTCNPI